MNKPDNMKEILELYIKEYFNNDTEQIEIAWKLHSKILEDGTILFAMPIEEGVAKFNPIVVTSDYENLHIEENEIFDTIKRTLEYAEGWKDDLI